MLFRSLHLASSFVLALIVVGTWFRRKSPRLHVGLMVAAFVVDLSLVVYIEATRLAIETVSTTPVSFVHLHALISTLVLVAYVAQLTLGWRVLTGVGAARRVHATVGIAFVSLRSLNYLTSLFL